LKAIDAKYTDTQERECNKEIAKCYAVTCSRSCVQMIDDLIQLNEQYEAKCREAQPARVLFSEEALEAAAQFRTGCRPIRLITNESWQNSIGIILDKS
jgi:hypothetical protein